MDGWRVPSTTLFPTGPPQLNHVALSLRPELLSGEGRRDIARFFRKVFGWRPIVMKSVDPGYLVLSTNRADQFIFLCPQPAPMVARLGMIYLGECPNRIAPSVLGFGCSQGS